MKLEGPRPADSDRFPSFRHLRIGFGFRRCSPLVVDLALPPYWVLCRDKTTKERPISQGQSGCHHVPKTPLDNPVVLEE